MFRCKRCDHEFEEPQYICERERIDYGIGARWVTVFEGHVCPKCESAAFEETEESDAPG